jgi:hypothetical protein
VPVCARFGASDRTTAFYQAPNGADSGPDALGSAGRGGPIGVKQSSVSATEGSSHDGFQPGGRLGQVAAQLRGLMFAHLGWLFGNDPTSWSWGRYAPDLLDERSMTRVSRAFPLLCAASLVLPALVGLAIGGTRYAAFTALIWAGLVRVGLLQHVTWSVNSQCHVLGTRPFATRLHDRATNLWPLALISFGESWHNMHHSDPTCARHGGEDVPEHESCTALAIAPAMPAHELGR